LPSSLMERALRRAGLGERSRAEAIVAAQWVPELRVRAAVESAAGPTSQLSLLFVGELAWPLGRSTATEAVAAERLTRQTSAQRQRLIDSIAEAWQRRQRAADLQDDVAAELTAEEADAELEARTGEAAESGP